MQFKCCVCVCLFLRARDCLKSIDLIAHGNFLFVTDALLSHYCNTVLYSAVPTLSNYYSSNRGASYIMHAL